MHKRFLWGNVKEWDSLKHFDIDGRVILKRILRRAWTGTIWLCIVTDGGLAVVNMAVGFF